jgi:hypothetical protein
MIRSTFALVVAGCLAPCVTAGVLDGTIIGVSKTGFTLQTAKGPKSLNFADYLLKDKPSPYGKTFDLLHRLKAADVREGMEVRVEYRKAGTDWICEGLEPRAARINFDPLAKADGKYTLQLTLVAVDGTKFEKKYEIEAGTSVEEVRNKVQRSLQPVPPPKERWAVAPYWTKDLDIDGYIKGDKFSPIERVEVNCPELKRGLQPEVKQRWKPPSK